MKGYIIEQKSSLLAIYYKPKSLFLFQVFLLKTIRYVQTTFLNNLVNHGIVQPILEQKHYKAEVMLIWHKNLAVFIYLK